MLSIRGKVTEKASEQQKPFKFGLFLHVKAIFVNCLLLASGGAAEQITELLEPLWKANQLNDVFCELVYDRDRPR